MQSKICVLGRQPNISLAELETLYGAAALVPFSPTSTLLMADQFDIQKVGGIIKAGNVLFHLRHATWDIVHKKIIHHYSTSWRTLQHKQTIGISIYDWNISPRESAKVLTELKHTLKRTGVSLRIVPATEPALNTASSHHNKLGLAPNKTELLIIRGTDGSVVIAESTGAQNITALAARDQGRPKRDAFVGMLPPKLALTMVNLAAGGITGNGVENEDARAFVGNHEAMPTILDPFCGTGVLLQEAALRGYNIYGTDLSEKMVDYSIANLQWAKQKYRLSTAVTIHLGDAIETHWQQPINAVASETYLGQPFSAPPSPAKLTQVRGNCNEIIKKFLLNLAPQIASGTPLCLAVPAWRDTQGRFTHLPLIARLEELGYQARPLQHVRHNDLIYYREDQVVARQLLVLVKS